MTGSAARSVASSTCSSARMAGSEPERSSCLRSNGYFDLSIPYRSAIFVFGSHMPIQWLVQLNFYTKLCTNFL
ncbi:hypothetical protein DAI22_04g183700 [Oryza sativa Japonica Group]|nr:hypothetical protein DAI22_04g183700 [Oryza sativa Japonica Group]